MWGLLIPCTSAPLDCSGRGIPVPWVTYVGSQAILFCREYHPPGPHTGPQTTKVPPAQKWPAFT